MRSLKLTIIPRTAILIKAYYPLCVERKQVLSKCNTVNRYVDMSRVGTLSLTQESEQKKVTNFCTNLLRNFSPFLAIFQYLKIIFSPVIL